MSLPLLALAGLAEAALLTHVAQGWLGLLVIFGLMGVAYIGKFRALASATVLVLIVFSVWMRLWTGLSLPPPLSYDDSDVEKWNQRFHLLSIGWLVLCVYCSAVFFWVAQATGPRCDVRKLSDPRKKVSDQVHSN